MHEGDPKEEPKICPQTERVKNTRYVFNKNSLLGYGQNHCPHL